MIVGVHGIGQQQSGRAQLLRDWAPAISDGIEAATGRAPTSLAVDVAFYGNLFLTKAAGAPKGAMETSAADLLADLDTAELSDLDEAVAEIVSAEEVEAAARFPPTMGVPHVPSWLQARFRAIDAKFGAAAGVLYVGELRQVRRYLCHPELKAKVDAIVAAKMAVDGISRSRILVGHSLGSVVAWEFVRQHPEHELDLLLTLGSPLGLRMVRSRLPEQGRRAACRIRYAVGERAGPGGSGGLRRRPRDLVAGVEDLCVYNGRDDAHSACRYLSKAETGSAMTDADPRLCAL